MTATLRRPRCPDNRAGSAREEIPEVVAGAAGVRYAAPRMSFLDDVKEWTDVDVAALVLGRALGLFSLADGLTEAKAILWTNSAAGQTLYGLLERLCWLGVLERDEAPVRYRSARPRLHALDPTDDVPALEAGPPPRAHVALAVDGAGAFQLSADRAGFRYLAQVFEEIANSGLEPGWRTDRDPAFRPATDAPALSLALVDPGAEDPGDKP
jgi:hypothetical protein